MSRMHDLKAFFNVKRQQAEAPMMTDDQVAETRQLAGQMVREIVTLSDNPQVAMTATMLAMASVMANQRPDLPHRVVRAFALDALGTAIDSVYTTLEIQRAQTRKPEPR